MSKENVEHIIRKFGSQQRVAELLGIWQTAVSGWVRRGAIPARRQEELLAAARREGVDLLPADFFGGTEQDDGTNGMGRPAPRRGGPCPRASSFPPPPPQPSKDGSRP